MNTRALLHTVAILATAIAGGTAVIGGVGPEVNKIIVSIASLASLAINTYMGFTTSGSAAP